MTTAYITFYLILVLFFVLWTFYLTHERIDHLRDDLYKHIDYLRDQKKADR